MTSQKHGLSALGLQRALGLGSYQTAWMMLHRFRAAMVRPGREQLAGTVEVDETYVGGEEPCVRGRQTNTKSIVVIAVEVHEPRGFGRARLQHVHDVSADSPIGFVQTTVQAGATVHTDGWRSYVSLPKRGYAHTATVLSGSGDPAHVAMPAVHRVASLLKPWLLGTHQDSVSPQHPRRLPQRVHVALQPPQLAAPRAALPPPAQTGRADATHDLQGHDQAGPRDPVLAAPKWIPHC